MTHSFSTLFLTLPLLFTLSSSTPNTTIYETLTYFGLPPGLLPGSVTSYTLDSETGRFTVDLPKPCYLHFDYLVYYDKRIVGTLKLGSITNLEGFQVRKFLIWFNVDEIRVDLPPSDSIYFHVGLINKKLDVAQFEAVRPCEDNGFRGSSLLKCQQNRKEQEVWNQQSEDWAWWANHSSETPYSSGETPNPRVSNRSVFRRVCVLFVVIPKLLPDSSGEV